MNKTKLLLHSAEPIIGLQRLICLTKDRRMGFGEFNICGLLLVIVETMISLRPMLIVLS
jgi:hypothetical protein